MIKNKASWVALGVLAIATALMVFVVQPNLRESDKEAVAQSGTGGQPARPAATDAGSSSAVPLGTAAKQAAAGSPNQVASSASDPATAWVVPGFDVLRVEPDGSTVVAGRAQPNTKLEILSGDAVVGTADVGAGGDFAAVFDKPLPAGDHQLTLRSVGSAGQSKSSEEVATVSVPKDASGQLLAMVSRQGKASRLITTPDAEPKPVQEAVATGMAPSGETGGASGTSAAPATVPGLQVTAVEIEGSMMYVAGNAKPGALVRIYANDQLLGEVEADDKGHFVVDGPIELSIGSHIIRADMMNEDASKVAMRASVPFDRPEGAQVAAIAGTTLGAPTAGLDRLKAEAGKALTLLRGLFSGGKQPSTEQLAAARSATEFALQSLAEFKPADTSDPALAAAAAEASDAASTALAALKASPQDAASVAAAVEKVDGALGSALTRQNVSTSVASAEPLAMPTSELSRTAAPPAAGDAAAPAAEPAAATGLNAATEQPETIEQAPLKESKTSVIIRRGDTLWQISRRVYGAGLRYTTIYLANREQIENPDLIRPGQVFGVPDEMLTEEESREIHRKHMRH